MCVCVHARICISTPSVFYYIWWFLLLSSPLLLYLEPQPQQQALLLLRGKKKVLIFGLEYLSGPRPFISIMAKVSQDTR